jgi:two-component system phosphate regulon sensor histidine kinase PhoR
VVKAEEIDFVRGDGTRGTMWTSSAPIRDRDGRIVAGVTIFDDITERKQAELEIRRLNEELEQRVEERTRQLEQERATLDAILNNLTEGVVAADLRERVIFANPAAKSMLSLGSEEPLEELPDPWEDFRLPEVAARCVEEGECIEARVQGGETLLHVNVERLPEFDEHGGGSLIVIRDLSEGRRLEARQQRFLINAAHELKTPITTILGASDLLLTEDEEDPEVRRRFLKHIFTEAQRMQRLSETLLRLARVGRDLREPELEVVDLAAAAREVIYRMEPLAGSAGIELTLEGQGARVRADAEWLEQALLAIASNALKYSNRGGRVRLRLEDSAVAVEDEGAGISADDLPHVFDRFYQGEESAGGFGLGLPICKELVERMGGEISIDSEEGVGTMVEINLPEVQDG